MTDDEMVLAAATWLGERVHTGQKWRDIYEGTQRDYLGYARGMLIAAEVIGLEPAPAPAAPMAVDLRIIASIEAREALLRKVRDEKTE